MSSTKVWYAEIWSQGKNDAEVKKQYQVNITNRFAALENFDENVNMNRAWENIKENIKTSAKESLGH
jgi:hypothetical protein